MAKTNPAQFVRQVRQEINRITWASRRETMFASLSVFVMALIASIFFLLVDEKADKKRFTRRVQMKSVFVIFLAKRLKSATFGVCR